MRPVVSKKGLMGFEVEISIDIKLSEKFTKELRDDEKEDSEIHEHLQNRRFHFSAPSVERLIQLAKKWDYYLAHKEIWEQSVRIWGDTLMVRFSQILAKQAE